MIHASAKYNRIQDPAKKIGEDEPVFLIRSQDVFAPRVIAFWADLVDQAGGEKKAEEIREFVEQIKDWQSKNSTKIPD